MNEHPEKFDVGILLGAGIGKDGSITPVGLERVELAVLLFSKGYFDAIISSGGNTSREIPEKIEAKIMSSFLERKGVPQQKIILEYKSKNTLQNALYSKDIVEKKGFRKILVITSDFHMERALMIFRNMFPPEKGYYVKGAESKTSFLTEEIKNHEIKDYSRDKLMVDAINKLEE